MNDHEALEAEARRATAWFAHGTRMNGLLPRLANAIAELRRERDEAVARNAALLERLAALEEANRNLIRQRDHALELVEALDALEVKP